MNKDIVGKIFPQAVEDYETGVCTTCREPVGVFRDRISKKEYQISGMCQACQDEVFDIEEGYYGDN